MQIPLTQGYVSEVDDEDFAFLSSHRWCAHRCGTKVYAVTRIDGKTVRMHSLITGYPLTDHIDGDGLNNRRLNLRRCNRAENMQNSSKGRKHGATSRFKGVRFRRDVHKWEARIQVNGKSFNLGMFDKEEAAAYAYRIAALQHFGEFAYTGVTA